MAVKERKVRLFRLKKGVAPHYEPNPDYDRESPEDEDNLRGIEYEAGDKVKSTRPLDKIFVNKFEPLDDGGDRSQVQSAGGDTEDDPENDPDKDRPVRSVQDAINRRADRHLTEEELEGKPKLQKLAHGHKKTKNAEVSKKMGDDVTDDYEGAADASFKVFRKGDKYSIADEDDPSNPMKKGLKKSQVKNALKKLMEDGDEE